jgi:hypothetical protein
MAKVTEQEKNEGKEDEEIDDVEADDDENMEVAQLICAQPGIMAVLRDDEGEYLKYPVLLFVLREWPAGGSADIVGLISTNEGLQNAESVSGGEFVGYLAAGQSFKEFLADHYENEEDEEDEDDDED